MESLQRIIQVLDNKVLESGRGYITPSEAAQALKSYGMIKDVSELKEMLEHGKIPHAYQTENSRRWWRIPLSSPDAKYTHFNDGWNVQQWWGGKTSGSSSDKVRQKRGCLMTILFIILFPMAVGYCNSTDYNDDGTPKKVQSSSWDGSVQQVVKYLKNEYLIDPLSYQPIEWSPVQEVSDGYWVRHKYRARNGFGGYVVENKVFHLNKSGKVDKVQDY